MTDHITIPRALLEQALEALESCDPGDWSTGHVIPASYNERAVEDAINDIRAELAKPTVRSDDPAIARVREHGDFQGTVDWLLNPVDDGTLLYLHPPTVQHDSPETIALKAERDAAMKDAERYRWLRYGNNDEKVLRQAGAHYWYLLRNEKLDTAIDAAIAKAEGRTE